MRYRSDGLVTAIKQECPKVSFKTMFQIAQDDFCRQTVPNDRCGVGDERLAKSVVSLGTDSSGDAAERV